MALVASGYDITFVWGGIDDSTATRVYHSTAADEAAAVVDAASIIAEYNAIGDGNLKSYSISRKFVEDAYTRPTENTTEQGDAIKLTGEIEGNPTKTWNMSVPYPKLTVFLGTEGALYNEGDITDADLLAWVALFATGGNFTLSDGELASGTITKAKRA